MRMSLNVWTRPRLVRKLTRTATVPIMTTPGKTIQQMRTRATMAWTHPLTSYRPIGEKFPSQNAPILCFWQVREVGIKKIERGLAWKPTAIRTNSDRFD